MTNIMLNVTSTVWLCYYVIKLNQNSNFQNQYFNVILTEHACGSGGINGQVGGGGHDVDPTNGGEHL